MKWTLAAAAGVLLASTIAGSAADMAVKAPVVVPPPVWTWTGFYLGAHVGAGWGTTEASLTSIVVPGAGILNTSFPIDQNSKSGFLGGGQIGYNWQSGWAVFGVQADIAGLGVKGTTPCVILFSCTSDSKWLATVSGRIGGVVADKTLVYVKGGAAWLNTTHSFNAPTFGNQNILGTFTGLSADSTALGWLLGFGAEYAFSPNWTAFIEYDYMDFQSKNVAFAIVDPTGGPAAIANVDVRNKLSIAKIGVNYKFGYGY